jgi:glycogen phosphorylase
MKGLGTQLTRALKVFFFGHLAPTVEDVRYQHTYHPVPVEQKSAKLATVLNVISSGRFGHAGVFEP